MPAASPRDTRLAADERMHMKMSKTLTAVVALFAISCGSSGGSGSSGPGSVPGRADISVAIEPNPIVATRVNGETYDFPFSVVVREHNGVPVSVSRVSAEVRALGAITIHQESYDAARINQLGYSTQVPAGGTVRYSFKPRKEVPDDRLFGGVAADLRVEGTDANGNAVTTTTTVTVTR